MPELVHVHKYVYTLDELEPGARRKALEILTQQMWEAFPNDLIDEMIYEMFCKKAGRLDLADGDQVKNIHKLGLRIGWSVSYTQSDCVELTGKIRIEDFPGFSTYGPISWPRNVPMIEVSNGRLTAQEYDQEATDRIAEGLDNYSREWTQSMDFVRGIQHDLYWYARECVDAMMAESEVVEQYHTQMYPRRFIQDGRLAPADFWQEAEYVAPVVIKWTEHDIASLLGNGDETVYDEVDIEKARDILARVSKHLKDRSTELGWEVLETLVADDRVAND